MSVLNEAAQWAVLLFLSIFVLGLTRQLGNFLTAGREQRSAVQGPEKGREIPRALVTPEERSRLTELMRRRHQHERRADTAGGWSLQTAGSSAGVMVSWGGPSPRDQDMRAGVAALVRSLRRVA